jgi:hypothetical protein
MLAAVFVIGVPLEIFSVLVCAAIQAFLGESATLLGKVDTLINRHIELILR